MGEEKEKSTDRTSSIGIFLIVLGKITTLRATS